MPFLGGRVARHHHLRGPNGRFRDTRERLAKRAREEGCGRAQEPRGTGGGLDHRPSVSAGFGGPAYAAAMWAFPLAAAAVSFVFGVSLARQFLGRRRPHQAIWAIALIMYAAASFALFLGVLNGWTTAEYRVYWLFGAVLNVPYLTLGESYLLIRRSNVTTALLVLVLFASAFAMSRVRTAAIDMATLS